MADCDRVAKSLPPHMPGFVSNKKSEIFVAPIGNVLRGCSFESTAHAREEFYFWWFFMPVCEPVDHIDLSNGARVHVPGGNTEWRADLDNLTEKLLAAMEPIALPYLRSINSNQDMIDALYRLRGEGIPEHRTRQITDIFVQHDIACLHILDGRYEEAEAMLDQVIAHEHGIDRRQWILDVVERTKGLRAKLLELPEMAIAQIREWQDYTFKALELERWR